ncbi:MAG: ABC transporter ATP-binding protein [Opitutales bacterium]|nr:ABC transporter ATP-binding protein [Opitutales bacterium]
MLPVYIDQVTKRFGDTLALNNVSLNIEAGELFFLLGPSGCGKTTLLRSLAGFYTPESGEIRFDKKNVTNLPPHKRQTGMMFQSYALWPHMTVFKNVAFGLEQQKVAKPEIKERVDDALKMVKMEDYAERRPNQLSGGQQQRVALARALVVRPKCLLLDEPLSNLDAKLRNEMRTEIREICKRHKLTTVYVTHDQKEALSIADRMAVMDKGEITQIGTPEALYKRPASAFVSTFIGETNLLPGVVQRVAVGEAIVETPVGTLCGALTNPKDVPAEGTKVHVSIRPESIHLETQVSEDNCIKGVIAESVYFGEVAHFVFKSGDHPLKVAEINPRRVTQLEAKDLYARIDSEDVVVLNR